MSVMESVLSCLLLLLSTHCLLVTAQAEQGISFTLRGESYSHNDLVNMEDIGAASNGLIATTTYTPCCTDTGDWFLPGQNIAISSQVAPNFYQSRNGNGELVLNRGDFVPSTAGLFRVNIPNASGALTDVYMALYTDTGGDPSVTSLTYDAPMFTCLSSGGPATTVVWRRNCSPLTLGTASQSVTDSIAGAYTSTLTLPTAAEDGAYSCTVENRRGRSSSTVRVGAATFDVTITPSETTPIAGQPLTLTCGHNSADTTSSVSFQWLDKQGIAVSDNATLTFDLLRESQREFYCVVTVGTAVGCAEYYSNVEVPAFGVSMPDASGVAGMGVTLTCTLSGPSVTMAMYQFLKGGVPVPSSQGGSPTHTITPALLSHAGDDYSCQVIISLDYLDLSSPLTVHSSQPATVTLTIPSPSMAISISPSPPYSGVEGNIRCAATTGNIPGVNADITLIRVEDSSESEVMSTLRISAGPVVEAFDDVFFQRSYAYSPFSNSGDSGSYVCEGTITPEDAQLRALITDGTSRSLLTAYGIVDPTLAVDVTMVTDRILDIAPYNTYSLTCTASSRVKNKLTDISKTIEWSVSINGGVFAVVTEGVVTNDLGSNTSSSVLSVVGSDQGHYTYRCRSVLDLGGVTDVVEGAGISSVTVNGPAVPAPPTSLTVLSVDHQSASFQWMVTAVAYDNESYIVTFGRDSNDLSNSSVTLTGPSDITLTNRLYSVSVGGLQQESSYYYRVVATNRVDSTESELAVFNTTGVGPSAPLSLGYTRTTPTNHTFSWLAPNDTDVSVDQYRLTCQGALRIGDTLDNIVLETVMTSVTSDLVPWANYTCFVVASNNDGSSPRSNEITFTTPETAPSGLPDNFVAGIDPPRGMVPFTWTPLPVSQRNGFITGYSLTCSGPSDTVAMVFPPDPDDRYTAVGFSALTSYFCSVRAVNSAGEGPPANITIITGEDVPGAPPMTFSATAESDVTVLFNWSPPLEALHNGALTDYLLSCGPLSFSYTPEVTSATEEGFSPATQYNCQLSATTAIGPGPAANVTIVTFPSMPTVSVSAPTSTQLGVTWTTPPDAIITEHIIYLNGMEIGRSGGSEFIVMGLQPYTEYSVVVSASNEAGEGSPSTPQTIRTLEDLPGRVQCLPRWEGSTPTSVTIRWNPPAQENGITLYYHIRLLRYGDSDSILAETNVTSTGRNVTLTPREDLVAGVPYTVEVVAENSIGQGRNICQSIDFYEQLEPPAPSNLVVTRTTGGLFLSWDVPTLLEARGYVSYSVAFEPSEGARRRRQTSDVCTVSPCIVPVENGGVVISGLNDGTTYDLTVTPSNENRIPGMAATATAPGVSPSSVGIGLIAGAAGGGVAVIIVLIILIILVSCCIKRRTRKGRFRPESPLPLDDMPSAEKSTYSAVNPTPTSSGTTSPRREFTSPVHMSLEEFREPVELEEFSDFVEHMHQNRNKGFERAFQSLPGPKLQSSAVAEKIPKKNRFQNIHPYDETRVKLQQIPGEPDSHYINASFVDGYNKPGLYIAAQGPLPNTVDDFWRMVWEYKLEHIVMLTKLKEGGKTKCQQYWPGEVNKEYITPSNSLSIVCHEHTPYADYEIRKFFMTDLNEPNYQGLVVNHYLFTSWPDHGVPEYATALIGFIRRVRSRFNPEKAPLLVHCSAGVGRTGTFIVLDTMLERIKAQSSVNVYQTLQDIRTKRAKMVQTQDQFVFIHDALNDLIRCGDTEIPSTDIRTRVAGLHKIRAGGDHISEFNYQFQLLNEVSPTGQPLNEALQHYNTHKNRYQDKVPNTNSCVYLSHTGVPGGEYINASFINGYKQPKAYIATQAPLGTTVVDFWRMVWEFQSRAVVMLCDLIEEKEEKSFQWWPVDVDNSVTVGALTVTLVSEEDLGEGLVRRNLTVSGEKSGSPGHTRLSISLFHYTHWSENDRPLNTEAVLKMVDEVNRVQRSTSNKPITVMCNDGMGRTGAFICIHAQLERLKTEGVMDVFQFAKSARFHRAHLIIELEHYIFCHDVLADFVETLSEASGYSNF